MAMDLFSEIEGWFRFDVSEWKRLLELARGHGWEPMGTESPDLEPDFSPRKDWDGSYFSNDYQTVTAEDARNLADALERAIADLPNRHAKDAEEKSSKGAPEATGVSASPNQWLSDQAERKRIREFIRYCRAGEFVIG
jgi:hypothetical protein